VLDNGQADLSIVFTSDGELNTSDKYVILEDDEGFIPAGNPIWITTIADNEAAGPDYEATIEAVQEGLSLAVMQELNARVSIDKEEPAAVATDYLKNAGYIE
jgi:glycine betaine/choline ABC-type transport system substrate-binding protein